MSLRPLTAQERSAALAKAAAARTTRAEVKSKLKTGAATVAEVLSAGDGDDAIGRLKITELLEALPGIGKVRSTVIMNEVGIAPTRRLRGLGIHQRKALIDFLGQGS
ncbi:integration host factor, actinobacterial type [Paenarthrobacter sp. PH39-S1]|uniref:integration host factor, actinobacterial type n=1 Tax=Micrococcaceae TaxID=1268 RepID=UPI0024BAE06B|nr:integration host factor, actinobacterial type [Paenarthrobacter sp. PH39-S1]MDJ0355532.1 integration host factor, actinobacterial type [Paenarthrobacter sp. PH39-S1]